MILSSYSYAQNENKKWCFGINAGLDFMTSPPTILVSSAMNVQEGCSTIANSAGNLLFYTDGITIWTQVNTVMANGTGLFGGGTPAQGSLIVKQPGNSNLYYVFTVDGALGGAGFRYTVVDMSLASGQGSVTTKNVSINGSFCFEKITGTKHCNGLDYWIIMREYSTPTASISMNFKAYLLTSAGINTTAVVSPGSNIVNSFGAFTGCMKISPNGKKLAFTNYFQGSNISNGNNFELYDFDNTSGVISNSLALMPYSGLTIVYGYGLEFSPDGSKLYGSRVYNAVVPLTGRIMQWDLSAGSNTAIVASLYIVVTHTINPKCGSMQLAPNGKIYIAREFSNFLSVINNPNIAGPGCSYIDIGQSLGLTSSLMGLPNFISSPPVLVPPFTYTVNNSPICHNTFFAAPANYINSSSTTGFSITNILWNFGDLASGPNNSSTLAMPTHLFANLGTYTTQLIFYYQCRPPDTLKQVIIFNQPCISVSSTSITCATLGSATVTAINNGGPYSYTWQPTAQTGSVAIGLSPGVYTLLVSSIPNTISYSTTITFVPIVPLTGSLFNSDSLKCNGIYTGSASIINLNGGSGNQSYSWTNGISTYTTAFTTGLSAGIWSVNVTDALTGCQINQSFFITQPPALNLSLSANTPTTCAGTGISLTGTNSGGTASYTYTWTNGQPINTNTVTEFIAGTYVYTLNSTDANNCLTSNTIAVDFIPNPVLTVSNASICPLTVGTMTALGASSYTWASTTLSLTGASFTASPLVNTQYTVIGSALGCTLVAYPTIILYPTPTPIFTSNSPRCNGQNLQLNASGGVLFNFDGPQSFVSNLQSPVITGATPLYSGVYNLTVTSVNGCTASTSQTLTVNPTPSLSIAGATVCTSQTLNLNASSVAGATYLWNGAQNFSSTLQNPFINNPSVLASGNYSLKVLSPQNCSNTAVVNVSVIPPPSLTSNLSGNGTLCAQAFNGSPNSITLTAGGAATYTLATPQHIFTNNPNGPSSPLSTLPPYTAGLATATLTGSNGFCTAVKMVTFNVIPNPSLTVTSPTPVICAGKSFTYTSSGASSYTWGPGTPGLSTYTGPSTIASPTVTSVYSVIGGSLGCNSGTQTSTITVNPLPTVSITPINPSICLGDKINLTALGNGSSFYWSPNLALNTTTGAVVSAGPVSQQTYQVMTSLNSCTQIAMVTVSIIPLPKPEIILPRPRLCLNEVITLIGKGGDSYNWTGPNSLLYAGQTVSFVASSLTYGGTYILKVINGNKCKNKTSADLIVDDLPYGNLIPSSKYNCVPFTSEFVFDSHTSPLTNWTIENSSYRGNKFSHLFTVPGEYLITGHLQDTNTNCVNIVTFIVNAYPVPKADFKFLPEKPVESLETVIFTNNSTGDFQNKWNWFFIANNGFKSSNENTSYFFQDAGLYPVALIVQNKYGCTDTIVKTIKVESDFNIYVPNAFTPNGDELNDIFLPILRGTKFYTLSVFDRWGAKLFETNSTETGWDGTYKGEEAKQDVYVWKIEVSSNSGEQKVLTGQVTLTR